MAQPEPATSDQSRPGGSGTGSNAASRAAIATAPGPLATVSRSEVPWLTPARNQERQRTNRRLLALRQANGRVLPWQDFSAPFHHVAALEADVLRVHELLEKARSAMQSDAERQALARTLEWHRDNLEFSRRRLEQDLEGPVATGAPSVECQRIAGDLRARMCAAHDYLFDRLARDWDAICRRVQFKLPDATGSCVEVECRNIPGSALGSRFAGGYQTVAARSPARTMPRGAFDHVPDLAGTEMVDAGGELLYRGLRHRLIDLRLLNNAFLRGALRFGDRETTTEPVRQLLSRLISELLVDDGSIVTGTHTAEEAVNRIRHTLARSRPEDLRLAASLMRRRAGRVMVRELAAAALIADPRLCSRVYDGKPLELALFSVAAPAEDDPGPTIEGTDGWCLGDQCRAFAELAEQSPVELRLRGPDDGALAKVLVSVRVRQFALPPGALRPDQGGSTVDPRAEWTRLIGPAQSRELGGDVKATIDRLRARALDLRREVSRSEVAGRPDRKDGTAPCPDAAEIRNRQARLRMEAARLDSNARALREAGEQLKRTFAGWPGGVAGRHREQADLNREMLSRLALIGFLMGETPVLSAAACADIDRLECKTGFLAMVAANRQGWLPPFEVNDAWRACEQEFVRRMTGRTPGSSTP